MPAAADAQLVALIAAEVERDGGAALASRLIGYNPQIRRLLRDRRLLAFLGEHRVNNPIVTFQYSSTTLYQFYYQFQ
jgi:hypothetical protein